MFSDRSFIPLQRNFCAGRAFSTSETAQISASHLDAVRFRQFVNEIDDSRVLVRRGLFFRVLLKFRHEFV